MDDGETLIQTAARELQEETGLVVVDFNKLVCQGFVEHSNTTGEWYLCVLYEIEQRYCEGEPTIAEPHKFDGLKWAYITQSEEPINPIVHSLGNTKSFTGK